MPRALQFLGVPTEAGNHTQFFRFPVTHWSDPLHQPTHDLDTAEENTFTIFREGEFGEERGWLLTTRSKLVQLFSRIRKYRATIAFEGLFNDGTGAAPYSFFYEQATDLLLPTQTIDERFLGHGLCRYLDVIDLAADNCTGSATIFLDYYTQPLLQPGNTSCPFVLFDTDPLVEDDPPQICPRLAYSPFKNHGLGAWYIRIGNVLGSPGRKVDAQVNFTAPDTAPPGAEFHVGWIPEWLGGGDLGTASLQLGPILVPGSLGKSSGFDDPTYDVTIDDFTFALLADTNGYFENRKLDGTSPIYSISTGLRLIDPIPTVQD